MARLDSSFFPTLDESIVEKLHSRNIFTVYDFMLQTCEELIKKTGLSFKDIEKIREFIFNSFGGEFVNPIDIYEQELQDKFSTGIKDLDNLLKGGFHCRKIYEICGSSSAGKSQLCHWISMQTTLNASTEVHYIDASRNFSVSRIQMMLEASQCNDGIIGKVMSSIKVHQIDKMSNAFTILHNLSKMPNNDPKKSSKKLIIIDSLSVLCAMIPNTEINPILSHFASVCRFLVNHLRAVIIIVNTVRFEHGGNVLADINKKVNVNIKPSLGNYWLCVPNIRLLMTTVKDAQREISIWKSHQLENGKKCFVHIKDEGIFQS